MKEFIMIEGFRNPAQLGKYVTTRKLPKRKILQIVHNGHKYLLFFYTTVRKEEKRNAKQDIRGKH